MKVTLFTNNAACADIISVQVAHITMFEKNQLKLRFLSLDNNMIEFVKACIKYHVLIQIEGLDIILIPENDYQRVRYRFDS